METSIIIIGSICGACLSALFLELIYIKARPGVSLKHMGGSDPCMRDIDIAKTHDFRI